MPWDRFAGALWLSLPLLVRAGLAGPLDELGPVGQGGARHVETLVAVARDQLHVAGAEILDPPLLVGSAVAGPLHHPHAVAGGARAAEDVHALSAVRAHDVE